MSEDAVQEFVVEAGGVDADLQDLIQEGTEAFSKDLGPYLLAGLGQFAVTVPVLMLTGIVAYIGTMVGMMGGWFVGMIAAMLLASLGDLGALLGVLVMFFLPLLGVLVILLPILPLMTALLAPVYASLIRAVAAHQRGEKELSLSSAFDTLTQDLVRVIVTGLVLTGLSFLGLLFCYVGVLFVPILFGFVNTLVVLHRCSPVEALRIQIQHLRTHGSTHLTLGVLQIALSMIAGFVPVIGPMFLLDMQVRAHRKMFGDGPEPVVA